MKRSVLIVLALIGLGCASLAQAQHIFCKVTGVRQGVIVGEPALMKGVEDYLTVQTLAEGVTVPFDTASGLATGKRQHQPLTITKYVDRASPKLFMAAVTNETLSSVECVFYHPNRQGVVQRYFKITLTNARITESNIANSPQNNGPNNFNMVQTIKFTFQKITLEDPVNGISAEDDWETPVT